jgi:hypothetical protein
VIVSLSNSHAVIPQKPMTGFWVTAALNDFGQQLTGFPFGPELQFGDAILDIKPDRNKRTMQ